MKKIFALLLVFIFQITFSQAQEKLSIKTKAGMANKDLVATLYNYCLDVNPDIQPPELDKKLLACVNEDLSILGYPVFKSFQSLTSYILLSEGNKNEYDNS